MRDINGSLIAITLALSLLFMKVDLKTNLPILPTPLIPILTLFIFASNNPIVPSQYSRDLKDLLVDMQIKDPSQRG